jgi:hypothetical protein
MTSDLIARLEAATEGSRELDMEIDRALGRQMVGWERYTTSIDAALPGENIVVMTKHENYWAAFHQARDGGLYSGKGKTEAIARRVARLDARETET